MLHSRKAFTLLELMVAFIIMAILSAIAVPSLLGVVTGDQQSADTTSAIAAQDAAYYAANTNDTSPSYPTSGGSGSSAFTAVTSGGVTTYTFADGNTVEVTAPAAYGSSPMPVTDTTTTVPAPGNLSESLSTAVAIPSSVPADGVSTSTITFTIVDNSGAPIPGAVVLVQWGAGFPSFNPAPGTSSESFTAGNGIDYNGALITNANGQASYTASDTNVETIQVQPDILYLPGVGTLPGNGFLLPATATVTFTPVSG